MGFGGLYTSISGLRASKHSLNTVGHNISNANNPHYVRQSALHQEVRYNNIGTAGQQGTGVDISEIRQIRDSFLDMQLRRQLPGLGYYGAKSHTLGDVEAVFNEITNSGLQDVMNDFWNSFNELAKDPESLTVRGLVHESTVAVTDTVNQISDQLINIQRNLNREFIELAEETNQILEDIYSLNEKIKLLEAEGEYHIRANDLRDERNALLDRLHQLLPVKTYENSLGETVVHLKGRALIEGKYLGKIKIDYNDGNQGFMDIYWHGTKEKIDLEGYGELGGYMDVRDESIPKYLNEVDNLVKALATEINELHKKSYGLDGSTGIPFFVPEEGLNAGNIKINPELTDLNKIAVSQSGDRGDGEIGKIIYEIREKLDENFLVDPSNNNPLTLDEYYRMIITELGLERQEAANNVESQGFLVKSIGEKREGLSSVSLDEEMADMLRFQYAYTANSRVINAIDEMIELVVNRVGIVGR